ncbi:Flp pilus assembly protein CpaB [Actinokineospora iranica]|uniref:Flp pilus assembly protein CpaB n=1 Tax=Actinokineospora iranica TaxID=1271860 RepID=A0A1G6TPF0_9PSEU|nr:Flp pilus assembly protein CpaB [Actinokineospora iranica]SDD30930.1 Flp pilus assembly protein CpaB [Actinokineospora iranica]
MRHHDLPRLRALAALPRALTLRRAIALTLALLAGLLAIRPAPADDAVPLLVAAHPLAPGAVIAATDVRIIRAPPDVRPASALTDPADAAGRVLAGAIDAGEPITRVRLVGAENTASTLGPDAAAVPVRLADPAVAGLLRPGSRVDVVTANPDDGRAMVLARDAAVVTVRPEEDDRRGSLVLIALMRDSATQVASVSLGQPVTVTLR